MRLVFVSRNYLASSVAKSRLIKQDNICLDRVSQAMKWLNQTADFEFPRQSPRKSLQSHVIVAYRNDMVLCYASDTNKWFILPDLKSGRANLVSCQGNLYAISRDFDKFQRYEPLFNQRVTLKTEMPVKPNTMADTCQGKEMQVLVVQGEIYVCEDQPNPVLWKYNSDSNLWNSFPAFD